VKYTADIDFRSSLLSVCIASLVDGAKHGGLETYIRNLTASLRQSGHTVQCESDTASLFRSPRFLLHFMSRPRFRWIARRYSELVGRRTSLKIVKDCEIVHFVGTGWDLLGFPLERVVRRKQSIMTCWPAVHPGSWGDSPLDIDLDAAKRPQRLFT
jgi:hypothetical protein